MKHWQFYLALVIFILLFNVKVKEGNFDIPKEAEVYNSPRDLMNQMKGIMEGGKTNDMVENKNLKYEMQAANKYLEEATLVYNTDKETKKKCDNNLKLLNGKIKTEIVRYDKCLAKKKIQQKTFDQCRLTDLPKIRLVYRGVTSTLVAIMKRLNKCNNILAREIHAVDKCYENVRDIKRRT